MKTMRGLGSARRSRRGAALLYAAFGALLAGGMVATSLSLSLSAKKTADARREHQAARFLAEGGTEAAKKAIQQALANWEDVPTSGEVDIDGRSVAWEARPTGYDHVEEDESGIQTQVLGYEVRARAVVDGTTQESLRWMNARITPLFQFAVFYTNDLEVNPGANMTINGRVHTNGDMHLTSNGATLTLNTNYVRAVGDIRRNRKDDPNNTGGTVRIRQWVADPFSTAEPTSYYTMWSKSQMTSMGIASTSGFDSRFTQGHDADLDGSFLEEGDLLPFGPGALDYWGPPEGYAGGGGATVQCSDHDVGEAVVPRIGSIAMYEEAGGGDFVFDAATQSHVPAPGGPGTGTHSKGFYHDNAGLSIVVEPNGTTWKAFDQNGIEVTTRISDAGAVTFKNMYDARQANGAAGTVRVLDIDMQKLNASGKWPANGLLYAAHKGATTGTNSKGVRLSNGATLPAKLTVASENAVYVRGDYNKGSSTVAKKPAAVIGDAINLLSTSWNDTKTHSSGLPVAAATTYNMAMISGNQDTVGSSYNGGLENLPRFHENWTGKACNIKGSLVNTWNSAHATGQWVYGGNRYTAPNRNWTYDTDFNDVSKLPPFTPRAVSAVDVAQL
ncbi:MAG: hypothetical protein RL112_2877 [Planctomycetota bacterium]